MLRWPALLVPLMALAGCVTSPDERAFSVKEVSDNLLEWHGRTVFVSGYVWGCEPKRPCGLAEGPQASADEASLTVEYDADVTSELAKARGYKVLIEAEVNANCLMPGVICLDFPSELKPKRLIRAY